MTDPTRDEARTIAFSRRDDLEIVLDAYISTVLADGDPDVVAELERDLRYAVDRTIRAAHDYAATRTKVEG